MPLVRFEVKNEYGLGDPQLYRAESKREDPRAVLDGAAVAGLVGILRQLGDLAEFAADIFRDLHEQVTTTAARGRKTLARIQKIESALPSLEKAVQGQRSYIHFAYIAGSDWHANAPTNQNQLLSTDLPQFMVDLYEECRDPPRLDVLDKFGHTGAGACLKRYSDPSYFKRALVSSEPVKVEKAKRKKKKRGSRPRNGGISRVLFASRDSNSMQFASPSIDHLSLSGENASFSDTGSKSDLPRESIHFDSVTRSNGLEQVPDTNCVVACQPEFSGFSVSASASSHGNGTTSVLHNETKQDIADGDSQPESLQQQSAPSLSSVTWDEKTEIVKPTGSNSYAAGLLDEVQDSFSPPHIFETSTVSHDTAKVGTVNQEDIVIELAEESVSHPGGYLIGGEPTETGTYPPESYPGGNLFDEIPTATENFGDATKTLEPIVEVKTECKTKWESEESYFNYEDLDSNSYKLNEMSATVSDCFVAQSPNANSLSNIVLSDRLEHSQLKNANCHSLTSDTYAGNGQSTSNSSAVPERSVSELADGELALESSIPSKQDVLVDNESTGEASKTQDVSANISNLPSVSIWTNGGILGLEPSKPPDFSIKANSDRRNETKSSNASSVEERDKLDGNSPVGNISENSIKDPLLSELARNHEFQCRTRSGADILDHEVADVTVPGSDLTSIRDTISNSNVFDKNTTGISTTFSGLAQKFLSNSLQKRMLVAHAGLSTSSQLMNGDFRKLQEILIQNDHKDLPKRVAPNSLCEAETGEYVEVGSSGKPFYSSSANFVSSSPPLEHMKISFHPMNSLETSKLELEFSGGNFNKGVGDLLFPSFQLIPGPSTGMHDDVSETDDDTFCRSSVYSSDDLLSLHSESNSDLWEEDETSEIKKDSFCDDSRRISSSVTSASSLTKSEQIERCSLASEFEQLEVENGRSFNSIRNLPSVSSDVHDKRQQQEMHETLPLDGMDTACHTPNGLPPPPPLPPIQWRVVKPSDKKNTVEDANFACMEVSDQGFTIDKQQAQAHRTSCNDETTAHFSMKSDQHMTENKSPNHNYNFKDKNARVDLLHEVRSKSFIPSHTSIAKNCTSGPVTD